MRSRRATVQIAAFPSDHKVRCPLAPVNFFNRRVGSRIRLYRVIDMRRSRSSLERQQPPSPAERCLRGAAYAWVNVLVTPPDDWPRLQDHWIGALS